MRVAFAGTPPFAAEALRALLAAGHDVPLVLTQPDRPAGRGMRLTPSAVAQLAASHGLAIHKPASLKEAPAREPIAAAQAEVLVVAAYGLILPQAVLDLPRRGCLNIHASLLPRWRGAAPIHRAILAGDARTGITIMQMDAGLDTGPMLLAKAIDIGPRETTGRLTERLAALGGEAIVEALSRLEALAPRPQDGALATYAAKVEKREARIDWASDCARIDRMVRAFDPYPGAETSLAGEALKVWAAVPVEGSGEPGTVLRASPAEGLVVACGSGALRLEILQKPGGRRLAAADFLRGTGLSAGSRLGGVQPVGPSA